MPGHMRLVSHLDRLVPSNRLPYLAQGAEEIGILKVKQVSTESE